MNEFVSGKITTDEEGWPLIEFTQTNESLNTVALFLRDDVDILLPCCDELLEGMHSVLEGKEGEWLWSGNRFFLQVGKDHTSMTDKVAKAISKQPPITIDTNMLKMLVKVWRDFISHLPQQEDFASE